MFCTNIDTDTATGIICLFYVYTDYICLFNTETEGFLFYMNIVLHWHFFVRLFDLDTNTCIVCLFDTVIDNVRFFDTFLFVLN